MDEQTMSLITDYIDGTLTPEREKEFQQYVKEGHIEMEEVNAILNMQSMMESAESPEPSDNMRVNFYQMLSEAKKKEVSIQGQEGFFELLNRLLFGSNMGKLAFGVVVLIVGVLAGNGFGSNKYEQQLTSLNTQMSDMQEVLMVSMLKETSVSDRLMGIQMSNELVSSNKTVTDALFVTLNNDESTNVRIAALNTLSVYVNDPVIREGLINSILKQDSPLLQMALAELMVDLQEKKSIKLFEQIVGDDNTPIEIKSNLQESIEKIM
jgi:hypothetical protein